MTQVKTMRQLTQMIYDGVHDFFIMLNGGARSGKYMDYSIYTEKFYITNEIDDTDQELTREDEREAKIWQDVNDGIMGKTYN